MKNGLLELQRVAHDGVRVRADAGASSFRRRESLEQHLAVAREQVERLRRELDDDPASSTNREKAARARAAEDRRARLEHALREMPVVEALKDRYRPKTNHTPKRKVGEARVSSTDPEARVMKMGDGGWRPAYNIQLAADTDARFVVGVSVTNVGNDGGQILPMLEQLERRTGQRPAQYLVDGGFAKGDDFDALAARSVTVFCPVPKPRNADVDPHASRAADSDATAAWRARMATDEAKQIYLQRAATIETVNADLRAWRGLQQLPVRGATKVRALAMLYALTFNILRLPRSLLGF
jgi:hypothetical protein